jgi:hypothetical protein
MNGDNSTTTTVISCQQTHGSLSIEKILHILLLEITNLIGTKLQIMVFEW